MDVMQGGLSGGRGKHNTYKCKILSTVDALSYKQSTKKVPSQQNVIPMMANWKKDVDLVDVKIHH